METSIVNKNGFTSVTRRGSARDKVPLDQGKLAAAPHLRAGPPGERRDWRRRQQEGRDRFGRLGNYYQGLYAILALFSRRDEGVVALNGRRKSSTRSTEPGRAPTRSKHSLGTQPQLTERK